MEERGAARKQKNQSKRTGLQKPSRALLISRNVACMKTRQSARRAPPLSGPVFVVDDNVMLSEMAAMVLGSAGHTVRHFSDPKAVLEAFNVADPKPTLLVTDFEMGEMNGLELIRSLQKTHPALKTVMLSGTVDSSMVSLHPGEVHRFLGKPYQPAQLKNMVAELLRT
jgi:DNA-binding NtrC family response regulator